MSFLPGRIRSLALALLLPLAAFADNPHNAVVIQADFGGAVMPGVVFSVSKDIPIFLIQPLIELYDIDGAARSLVYNAQTWPAGTVFVSVVDPGVGTRRKSVVLKTRNGLYFVSPDNGTLGLVAQELGIEGVREIDESVNRRPGTEWSHTFHGRDVYSYTAARLAAGVIDFEHVGPQLEPKVVLLEYPKPVVEHGTATGMIDQSRGRLGNTTCLIDRHTFAQLGVKEGDLVVVTIRKGAQDGLGGDRALCPHLWRCAGRQKSALHQQQRLCLDGGQPGQLRRHLPYRLRPGVVPVGAEEVGTKS